MGKIFKIDETLQLECKKVLNPPIHIAYEAYGTLNKEKTNAILVCHALTGSACAYSENSNKRGFWDIIIGPNKTIDINKYFVICSNVLVAVMFQVDQVQ